MFVNFKKLLVFFAILCINCEHLLKPNAAHVASLKWRGRGVAGATSVTASQISLESLASHPEVFFKSTVILQTITCQKHPAARSSQSAVTFDWKSWWLVRWLRTPAVTLLGVSSLALNTALCRCRGVTFSSKVRSWSLGWMSFKVVVLFCAFVSSSPTWTHTTLREDDPDVFGAFMVWVFLMPPQATSGSCLHPRLFVTLNYQEFSGCESLFRQSDIWWFLWFLLFCSCLRRAWSFLFCS